MIFRSYCCILCDPMDSSGQSTEVGSLSLLQEIFPTQGLNPGLTHYRRILYQLSHQGSPGILEWVAYPFSSRSSQPRNQTKVSCIAGGFSTNWATREALFLVLQEYNISFYYLLWFCLYILRDFIHSRFLWFCLFEDFPVPKLGENHLKEFE